MTIVKYFRLIMSTKRKAETESPRKDQDPDYEMVSVMTASKRQRIFEKDGINYCFLDLLDFAVGF